MAKTKGPLIVRGIVVPFDVDETLVSEHIPSGRTQDAISIGVSEDDRELFLPMEENIRELLLHKARGHKIRVWSRGGEEWAAAVVKALKLEASVDFIECKPLYYVDDKPCQEWMGQRYYQKTECDK